MDEAVKLAILLAAKDVGSSVVKGFGESLHGLGAAGTAAKVGITGVAVAGAALIGAGLSFAKAAADEQVGVDRLHQAIKNVAGGRLKDIAAIDKQIRAGEMLAFSDDAQRDALTILLNETGSLTEARKRLTVAENFARGANIDLGTASKLLGKITDENVRVLGRYGIVVKKGSTETQLLQEVQRRFGGQAESYAKGATAQWQIFTNEMANLREDLGGLLLPVFSRFGTVAHEAVTKVRDVLADPKIQSAIDAILTRVGQLAQGFVTVLGKGIDLGVGIATKIAPMIGTGMDKAAQIFETVKRRIGDVVHAVQDFQKYMKLGDAAQALFQFLTDLGVNLRTAADMGYTFNQVLMTVKGVVNDAKTSFQELLDLMSKGDWKGVGERLGHALVDAVKIGIAGIAGLGVLILDQLKKINWFQVGEEAVKFAVPFAIGFIDGLAGALIDTAIHHPLEVASVILTFFFAPAKVVGIIGRILSKIPFVGKLLEWLLVSTKGVVDRALGPIGDAIRAIGGAFARGFEDAFGRHGIGEGIGRAVPTIRQMIGDAFRDIGAWIAGHVLSIARSLGQWVGEWAVRIHDAINRIPGAVGILGRLLWNAGLDLIKGLLGAAEHKWVEVVDWLGGLRQKAADKIGDLSKTLWNAGFNLIAGLWQGALSKWGDFAGWVSGLPGWIAAHKGPVSADRQLLIPHGLAIMAGLQAGLRAGWADTQRMVASMGTGMQGGFAAPRMAPAASMGRYAGGNSGALLVNINTPVVLDGQVIGRMVDRRVLDATGRILSGR